MAEYVSKEEARKILCDVCGCVGCDIARCPFWQELDKLLVADVVERKRGKWELTTMDDGYAEYQLYKCNRCGQLTARRRNFCHNCGADMRGDGDDNKQA